MEEGPPSKEGPLSKEGPPSAQQVPALRRRHREEWRLQPHHLPQVRARVVRPPPISRPTSADPHHPIPHELPRDLRRCWLCTSTYTLGHFKNGRCEQFSQDFFDEINLTRDEFEAHYVVTNHW